MKTSSLLIICQPEIANEQSDSVFSLVHDASYSNPTPLEDRRVILKNREATKRKGAMRPAGGYL
jgi:hypothetical protein